MQRPLLLLPQPSLTSPGAQEPTELGLESELSGAQPGGLRRTLHL
jgi:hypothetical protein